MSGRGGGGVDVRRGCEWCVEGEVAGDGGPAVREGAQPAPRAIRLCSSQRSTSQGVQRRQMRHHMPSTASHILHAPLRDPPQTSAAPCLGPPPLHPACKPAPLQQQQQPPAAVPAAAAAAHRLRLPAAAPLRRRLHSGTSVSGHGHEPRKNVCTAGTTGKPSSSNTRRQRTALLTVCGRRKVDGLHLGQVCHGAVPPRRPHSKLLLLSLLLLSLLLLLARLPLRLLLGVGGGGRGGGGVADGWVGEQSAQDGGVGRLHKEAVLLQHQLHLHQGGGGGGGGRWWWDAVGVESGARVSSRSLMLASAAPTHVQARCTMLWHSHSHPPYHTHACTAPHCTAITEHTAQHSAAAAARTHLAVVLGALPHKVRDLAGQRVLGEAPQHREDGARLEADGDRGVQRMRRQLVLVQPPVASVRRQRRQRRQWQWHTVRGRGRGSQDSVRVPAKQLRGCLAAAPHPAAPPCASPRTRSQPLTLGAKQARRWR